MPVAEMEHTAGTVILAFLVTVVSAETGVEERKTAKTTVSKIDTNVVILYL